jgi:hypothetical protein
VAAEAAEVLADRRHGGMLVRRQPGAGVRDQARVGPVRRRRLAAGPAVFQQGGQRFAPLAADLGQRLRATGAGGERRQHRVLHGRAARALLQALPAGRGDTELQRRFRQRATGTAQGRRQSAGHHFARRMLVVLPAPAQQVQQRGIEHRFVIVQHGRDGQQAGRRHLAPPAVADHDAEQLAAAERHDHPAANGRRRTAGRGQVVEQLRERNRQGHLDEGGISHRPGF